MIGKQNAQGEGKRGNTAGRKVLGLTRSRSICGKTILADIAPAWFAKFCVLT